MKYPGLVVVSLLVIGLIVLPVTRAIKIVMIAVALALLLFVKRSSLYVALASRALNKGEEEKAWRLYHKAWKAGLQPKYNLMLGNLFSQKGDADVALQIFDKVIKRATRFKKRDELLLVNAKTSKSMALWILNRRDEAIDLLQSIRDEGWIDKNIAVNLGSYLLEEGRLNEAKKLIKESSKLLDESPGMLDNRGYHLYLTGSYHEAQRLYDSLIIDREPQFPEAYYHAALVKIALGKHRTSVILLRKALECPFYKTSTVTVEQIEALLEKQEPLVESDVGEHEFIEDVLGRTLYEEEIADEEHEDEDDFDYDDYTGPNIELDIEDYRDESDSVDSVEIENFSPLESHLFDEDYEGDDS
jgi:tetratricopeptide (TPR) repeat protein